MAKRDEVNPLMFGQGGVMRTGVAATPTPDILPIIKQGLTSPAEAPLAPPVAPASPFAASLGVRQYGRSGLDSPTLPQSVKTETGPRLSLSPPVVPTTPVVKPSVALSKNVENAKVTQRPTLADGRAQPSDMILPAVTGVTARKVVTLNGEQIPLDAKAYSKPAMTLDDAVAAGMFEDTTPKGVTMSTADKFKAGFLKPYAANRPQGTVIFDKNEAIDPTALTSPAALNFMKRRAIARGYNEERTNRGGSLRGLDSTEAQRLEAQWEDAARKAFLSGMSPSQQAKFKAREDAEALQKFEQYKQTPQAYEQAQQREATLGVARAEADKAERAAQAEMQKELVRAQKDIDVAKLGKMTPAERLDKALTELSRTGLIPPEELGNYADALRKQMGMKPLSQEATDATPAPTAEADAVSALAPKPVAPKTKRYTPAEAKKLPVGTIYEGTDGKTHRKV